MQLGALCSALVSLHQGTLVLVVEKPEATLAAIRDAFPALVENRKDALLMGVESAALAQLARSVAVELGPHGLRANALAVDAGADDGAVLEAAAFLLSDEASYVTGVTLRVG